MINVNNASNVEISGMTLDGHNDMYAGQGISVTSGSGENFNNLCIQNLYSLGSPNGILFNYNATGSTISNNQFSNIGVGSWGFGIQIQNGSSANQVLNNTVIGVGSEGIGVAAGCSNTVVKGNVVNHSGLNDGPEWGNVGGIGFAGGPGGPATTC